MARILAALALACVCLPAHAAVLPQIDSVQSAITGGALIGAALGLFWAASLLYGCASSATLKTLYGLGAVASLIFLVGPAMAAEAAEPVTWGGLGAVFGWIGFVLLILAGLAVAFVVIGGIILKAWSH